MNFTFILLLKATAILSLSSILLFAFRRSSASLRHWIISLTLIGLLLLPFFTTSLPTWEVETTAVEIIAEIPLMESITPVKTPIPSSITAAPENNFMPPVIQPGYKAQTAASLPWIKILLSVWLLGGLVILSRLLVGIYQIRKISKAAIPYANSALTYSNKYQLLVSDVIQTPMTWRFIQPVILLPTTAKHWSTETLQTVIQHEAAHIQRGDYLIHILSWISVAVYWFHPLIWWLKNSQQIEREKACDEYVLKSGLSQQEYAEQLVHVARNLSGHPPFNPALPMAQFAEIKHRLFAILAFQKERFRFTRIKQFQWAGFYAGSILVLAILTPVEPAKLMKMVAPDHAITEILQKEKEVIQDTEVPINVINEQANIFDPISESIKHEPIKSPGLLPTVGANKLESTTPVKLTIPERPVLAETKFESAPVTTSEQLSKQAYYGQWSEGKSTYEVWTLGNINHSPELPYLEAATPDDMIIIEETRKSVFGNKKFRLIITKVEYDGGLIVTFTDGKPNSWNGSYKVGDPLFLYYEDDEFRFLGKQKTKWILDKLPELSGDIYMAPNDKKIWSAIDENDPNLQFYKAMKARQFMPRAALPLNDFEHLPYWKNARHISNPPFDFSSVPMKPKTPAENTIAKKNKKIGSTKKTRTTSGGNALNLKQKFGMVIPKLPTNANLKDFNFHLKQNDFAEITFSLSLYEVDDNGIQKALLAEPIPFKVTHEGWVNLNLNEYNLQADGEILAILELSDVKGKLGLDYLFFSIAPGKYKNFHERTDQEWGFWEDHFAWYFNVAY